MFFKLSLKNIKKSFKDYSIYFLTLVFGVAIFYIFNSMDSQTAMLTISNAKSGLVDAMIEILAGISVFVSLILGFLIVYANNFLIKRRKKEFAIYMTLGMGKGKISRLLLVETILIGILSLAIGLVIGIFASQFMSVFVAKMFEANMNTFTFTFSVNALLKTIMYFGVIYVFVMIFNTFAISKCKLINLLNASRKNEKIKIKNTAVSVILFILSILIIASAYYMVIFSDFIVNITLPIALGTIGTFMFFTSLSGFILKIFKSNKKLYNKNLNTFVLRQIDSKINTTSISMGFICLMLFLTICLLSSALAMNNTMTKQLKDLAPSDITIIKNMYCEEGDDRYTKEDRENTTIKIAKNLEDSGISLEKNFKEFVEISTYTSSYIDAEATLGNAILDKIAKEFEYYDSRELEPIISVSDYNKLAKLNGKSELLLKEDQYAILCDFETMMKYRNMALEAGNKIKVDGKEYSPVSNECIIGNIQISSNPINIGIIIMPDKAINNFTLRQNYFNGNYNENIDGTYLAGKIEKVGSQNTTLALNIWEKQEVYDMSVGLSAIVTFIGLYLGIIFLITSAVILALKELSESSDNKDRYSILRKIGTDEHMINKSLFAQIGIFFMVPLLLSIIHSIAGMMFANKILVMFGKSNILPAIIITSLIILCIYGGYFIATYLVSKSIIKESDK